jgi:putative hydrolase of the HAD superfamily
MVILFDIDGTLIDHDAAEAIAVAALRRALRFQEEDSLFLRRWRVALERHYDRYLAGELTLQEQRRERFREVFGGALSDGDADRWSAAFLDEYLPACSLYPDVVPALAELADYPMGIISNGERTQQSRKLQQNGIGHHFRELILSDECGTAKPARRIFDLACDAMGVAPSEAVYVGDRRDIDAEAAREAGLHGIWLDRSGLGEDSPWRIQSLAELPRRVESLR